MNVASFLQALHLIGAELCARTASDHNPLARFARRPGGITGHPVTGWAPSTEVHA